LDSMLFKKKGEFLKVLDHILNRVPIIVEGTVYSRTGRANESHVVPETL